MKFVIFIIVTGIPLIKSQNIEQRNKLTLDDLIKKCGVTKCPPVEDPRCLKLVHKEHSNRTLFIITANKCEKIYAECHGVLDSPFMEEGFDAKLLSMKYCEHMNLRRGHKNKPNTIRKKRSLTPLLRNDGDMVCPRQCTAGDTMLCARCQHGVYRSFLSDCHMRMFLCQNKDEELELESRLPCTFSSPYLLEPDMVGLPPQRGPQGADDTVMRFILCRDKYNVGTEDDLPKQFINDPDCQFKGLKTSDGVQNNDNNEGKSLLLPPLPNDDADKKSEQSKTEVERDSDDKEEKSDPKDSKEETDKHKNKQETKDKQSQDINEDLLENPSNKDSLEDINEEELANLSNEDNQEVSSSNKDSLVGSNEIEFANANSEASLEDKNDEELANKSNKESIKDGTDPDKPLKLIGNRYVVGEKGHGIPGLILDIGDINSDTARSN